MEGFLALKMGALIKRRFGWLLVLLLLGASQAHSADSDEPAQLKISGYGFFGNRELKALIRSLQTGEEDPRTFEATFIEDAVLVLFSRVARDGYLYPVIHGRITKENGEVIEKTWSEPFAEPLPRPLEARRVELEVDEGVLFYFDNILFSGLGELPLDEAAHFFVETDALIKLKKNRIYTPERLQGGMKNLAEALERRGFQSATVTATNLVVQTNTGAVNVEIQVDEGLKSYVQSIRIDRGSTATNVLSLPDLIRTNQVFSRMWLQDFVQELRREYYRQGYADAQIDVTQSSREERTNSIQIDLLTEITPGEQIRVQDIVFEGHKQSKEGMLRRRVDLEEGDLLNRVAAEQGRYRLARLGIFDTVDLRYDEVDEQRRNVVYEVKEGKRIDFSVLAGYGSYEQLRGGFEVEQYNLWGLAHHSRLRIVQSMKASSGQYTYTIPQVFGRDFDIFANASGLRREEISFTREEFGGGAGVSRYFRDISSDVSARYNYQVLNATRFEVPPEYGLQSADVSSFIFDLRHDLRDNPLSPRSGYKVFSSFEVASEVLAGDVDYQRFEISGSYHLQVGQARWLHFGLSHGFVTTDAGPEVDLPFNKRFFPGGDNSIRGYQFGEASPRDEQGRIVGAESYALANIEFEQGLTRTFSLIFFVDALGNGERLSDYPFNEGLFSVGGGLRWKTLIGPARLEYGYNLNRREEDPSGTLHFSIGFPF